MSYVKLAFAVASPAPTPAGPGHRRPLAATDAGMCLQSMLSTRPPRLRYLNNNDNQQQFNNNTSGTSALSGYI